MATIATNETASIQFVINRRLVPGTASNVNSQTLGSRSNLS